MQTDRCSLNGAGARRPARQGFGEAGSEAPPAPTAASPLPPVGSCVDLTTRARGVKPRPRAQLSFSASHGQAEKRQDGSRDVHPLVTRGKLWPDVISFRCLGQHVLTWKRFGEPVAGGRSKGLFRRHPLPHWGARQCRPLRWEKRVDGPQSGFSPERLIHICIKIYLQINNLDQKRAVDTGCF